MSITFKIIPTTKQVNKVLVSKIPEKLKQNLDLTNQFSEYTKADEGNSINSFLNECNTDIRFLITNNGISSIKARPHTLTIKLQNGFRVSITPVKTDAKEYVITDAKHQLIHESVAKNR